MSATIKRAAITITPSTRKKLETHMWRLYTENKMTQDAVIEYLATLSKADDCRTEIMYNGKAVPVISLPFEAVMFLKTSKVWSNYKYTFYHRETSKVPWSIWKEGTKTPPESLRSNNHLFMTRAAKNPLSK